MAVPITLASNSYWYILKTPLRQERGSICRTHTGNWDTERASLVRPYGTWMAEFLNPRPAPTLQTIHPLVHMRQSNLKCLLGEEQYNSNYAFIGGKCQPLQISSYRDFFFSTGSFNCLYHRFSPTLKKLLLLVSILAVSVWLENKTGLKYTRCWWGRKGITEAKPSSFP